MKKIFYLPILLALTACENVITENGKDVRMQFRIMTPSASRAESVADFKTLVVVDVQNGGVRQVVRKGITDGDFASPTLSLAKGSHSLRFLATDATATTIDGTCVAWEKVGDTFMRVVDVTASEGTHTVVLNRIGAKVINRMPTDVTIEDVVDVIDMATLQVTTKGKDVTLKHDDGCMTLVPASGLLMASGKSIIVKKNTVTEITVGGTTVTPQPGGEDMTGDDYLALTTDTALIYVARKEVPDVVLAETSDINEIIRREFPQTVTDGSEILAKSTLPIGSTLYRLPTRLEASELRHVTLPVGFWTSGQRALAYDDVAHKGIKIGSTEYGTGEYYTFLWGSGSVSKAGQKTKYTITPVRIQPLAPIGMQFGITADFTWDTDTIRIGN